MKDKKIMKKLLSLTLILCLVPILSQAADWKEVKVSDCLKAFEDGKLVQEARFEVIQQGINTGRLSTSKIIAYQGQIYRFFVEDYADGYYANSTKFSCFKGESQWE